VSAREVIRTVPVSSRLCLPWVFALAGLAALAVQAGGGREMLIYDRSAIAGGEWWRLWTGHWVHFGWPHFLADTGLLLVLGWLVERTQPCLARLSLLLLPAAISAALFVFDPGLERYAGLSAYNLGLLLYYAGHGWRRNWTDWFWPAVLLIYAGELVLEIMVGGGAGGGMIPFDDPTVKVATIAHFAGVAGGLLMLGIDHVANRKAV
jgi:rhomboid family GlyGly-CTERM serine protease